MRSTNDPQSSSTRNESTAHPEPGGQSDLQERFRQIPPVSSLVDSARRQGSSFTDETLTRAVRSELERVRRGLIGDRLDRDAIERRVVDAIMDLEKPRLTPVLNATGVIIHTNLGRVPVSAEAAQAMGLAAANSVALEIEPENNERGGRMREIGGLMRSLTGAEATLVVNNCASAVLLALAAVATGKGVIVSRGEAVEIGGGFRVPDILRQSGARLIEVGTTNRTYTRDYAAATDAETGAYLKVHPSNFRSFGYIHAASTEELAVLGREHGVPVLEDLGSGALLDTTRFGLAPEPTVTQAIAAGAELVMASGDKLLGGPQAGLIVGRQAWIDRVTRHPLARAVRADKTTLAGIAATLRHYARGEAEAKVPVWRMIGAADVEIRIRADRVSETFRGAGIDASVVPVASTVGGGSLPGETLPSWAVVLRGRGEGVDALARRARIGEPAVFGRIEREALVLDLRTVLPEYDEALIGAVKKLVGEN